jgi:long-chain acyl-CoA synthetase
MDSDLSPGQILRKAAARFPDKPALVTATRTLTYRELDEASDRFGAALAERGVAPGRSVSSYGPNRWEWVVAYHGALKAGAVINPVNAMLTAEELVFVLRDCDAAAVVTSSEQAAGVLALTRDLPDLAMVVAFEDPPDGCVGFTELLGADGPVPEFSPNPNAPCTIAYTSGTTGHPKGAVLSHRAVLLNCSLTPTNRAQLISNARQRGLF